MQSVKIGLVNDSEGWAIMLGHLIDPCVLFVVIVWEIGKSLWCTVISGGDSSKCSQSLSQFYNAWRGKVIKSAFDKFSCRYLSIAFFIDFVHFNVSWSEEFDTGYLSHFKFLNSMMQHARFSHYYCSKLFIHAMDCKWIKRVMHITVTFNPCNCTKSDSNLLFLAIDWMSFVYC